MISRSARDAEPDTGGPHAATGSTRSPLFSSTLLTLGYTATAVAWLLISAALLWSEIVTSQRATFLVTVNGALFVLITSAVLFTVIYRHLDRLAQAEERFIAAQSELRQKDLAVRQGYVDVLDAVTGGKLILVTSDELEATLGEPFMPPSPLALPQDLSAARHSIQGAIEGLGLADLDSAMLAASEALTNAVKHGGGGEYSLHRSGDCLQIVVRDFGPGIDFRQLPKATLVQGFSTTSTMGLGFTIMLEVCDRVLLTTDADGTVVVLEIEGQPRHAAPERSLGQILTAAL